METFASLRRDGREFKENLETSHLNKVLRHYTSAEGLYNIIQTGYIKPSVPPKGSTGNDNQPARVWFLDAELDTEIDDVLWSNDEKRGFCPGPTSVLWPHKGKIEALIEVNSEDLEIDNWEVFTYTDEEDGSEIEIDNLEVATKETVYLPKGKTRVYIFEGILDALDYDDGPLYIDMAVNSDAWYDLGIQEVDVNPGDTI